MPEHAHVSASGDGRQERVAALALIAVLAWFGYHHVAPLHDLIDHVLYSAAQTIDA